MLRKIISIGLILVLASGCARCLIMRSEYFDVTGAVFVPKEDGAQIEIFEGEPNRAYKEIGVVKVFARYGTAREAINRELRKRAGQAGADALINVRYGEDQTSSFSFCGKIFSTKRNVVGLGHAIVFDQQI